MVLSNFYPAVGSGRQRSAAVGSGRQWSAPPGSIGAPIPGQKKTTLLRLVHSMRASRWCKTRWDDQPTPVPIPSNMSSKGPSKKERSASDHWSGANVVELAIHINEKQALEGLGSHVEAIICLDDWYWYFAKMDLPSQPNCKYQWPCAPTMRKCALPLKPHGG